MKSKRSPLSPTLTPEYRGEGVSAILLRVIILLCCGLPIGWFVLQLVASPQVLHELKFDSFRLRLLGRTVGYNSLAAVLALMLGLPVAIALGRGRGVVCKSLWIVLPISLLLPSLAITYGWKQFVNLISDKVEPGSGIDVLRCIWTLATWLWPIPAGIVGFSLRRMDAQLQEQALLDGRLWRVTLRALVPAMIASFCIVLVLAVQEFAVYEPSGISVLATEVRMVFDTGGFSSPVNPINQQLGFGAAIGGEVGLADQRARAAAAVAAYVPLLGIILALALIATWLARRASMGETLETDHWPRALDAPLWIALVSWLVVLIAVITPILAMIHSLKMHSTFAQLWAIYHPQLVGSFIIAITTAIGAILLTIFASMTRSRGAMMISLLCFLIGGQMLAIALIRIYNQPWLSWVYNGLPIIVIAHLARFGWIALLAGDATWRGPWQNLRDISAVDGATRWQTLRRVIIPIALPLIGACALVILALALTEVPATVLISPQHPQPIVPMLMTWVHMLRYDAMIQVSLLLCGLVGFIGLGAVVLFRLALMKPRMNTDEHR